MTTYRFVVPGRPKAKGRPRFARGRAYTDKKTLEAEQRIADAYEGPFFNGPVSVSCTFSRKRTVITITDLEEEISPLTADLDNLCKTIKDGLNGVAYADDRYVQKLAARKK
tara:strand:- start:170 stop:502 length:333 start_codon:yes stop_codon:yes gene_type:complete